MIFGKLKIYNTLSGKKEIFKPLRGKRVNLFVCGPTVYDFSHIGHARTCVIFDCFAKYLKCLDFQVFYLQNITDIDDKIIARAREKGVPSKDLAEAFLKEYLRDMKNLRVTSVTKYAKATSFIKEIISQVKRLKKKWFAYALEDGIYFDISKVKTYGKLSHRTALQAEDSISRIDYNKHKKNRGDFCLWKFSVQGEPSWPSPFGEGRPGWHIEDTAITEKYFGHQYDIHGGCRDLIFPHHEAEISQMEAISGVRPMARYWMHAGSLNMGGQKMSKSLNNFITINDFLKRYPYQNLRFWVAKNLWSAPLDYSESVMIEVRLSLDKIEEFLRKIRAIKNSTAHSNRGIIIKARKNFYRELQNDFNTPKAFATLFEFIRQTNIVLDHDLMGKKEADEIYEFFIEINTIFDIIDFKKLKRSNIPTEVKELLKVREQYRKNSEWQKADEVRAEIEKYGFTVDDTSSGPVLKKI